MSSSGPSNAAENEALIDDAKKAATWVAEKLDQSGYRSDFSLSSVWEVERFFDDHAEQGKPRPGGLLDEHPGQRLFAMAAYLGETWRRAGNGTWSAPDSTDIPPQLKDFEIAVVFPNGTRAWPGRSVIVRFQNRKDAGDLVVTTMTLSKQGAFKWGEN